MSSFSSLFRCVAFQSFSFCLDFTAGWTSSGSWFFFFFFFFLGGGSGLFFSDDYMKRDFFSDTLAHSKNSKDTWRAINLLTNKHPPANTSTTSGISPDDVNNHFCSVARKVIQTGDFPPATNKLCWNSIAQKRLATKPMRSLLWQSEKCINTYVI